MGRVKLIGLLLIFGMMAPVVRAQELNDWHLSGKQFGKEGRGMGPPLEYEFASLASRYRSRY